MSKVIITTTEGTTQTATILPIDRVMFERHFGKSVGAIAKEERLEFMLWISWHAIKRQGGTALEFDGWLTSVADYDSEADDLPPLDPAASPTP
jgi:hypothetical protein